MNYDWNWFFSSFCQCAAALIGIIGAFVISRLLGLSERVISTDSEFTILQFKYDNLKSSLSNRDFEMYTKKYVRYYCDLLGEIRKGDFENLSDDEILNKIYTSKSGFYKIDSAVMSAFKEMYSRNRPRPQEYTSSMPQTPLSNFDIIPDGTWEKLEKEKEAINLLKVEVSFLIDLFKKNLNDFNSLNYSLKPLKRIIILMLFAFPLTVIYPLHFMPVITNQYPEITFNPILIFKSFITLKFSMLTVFFLVVDGLFYYFLKHTQSLMRIISLAPNFISGGAFTNIKSYSEYFENE